MRSAVTNRKAQCYLSILAVVRKFGPPQPGAATFHCSLTLAVISALLCVITPSVLRRTVMNGLWVCLLISGAVAYSQTISKPGEAIHPHSSIADFGLVYPLSTDWVLATHMLRKQFESADSPRTSDILLAAVYVPASKLSGSSPFFSLRAYRQPATDCKKTLEAYVAKPQAGKDKTEGGVAEFSAAGRDYFRVNMAHGVLGHHQCLICTTAGGHLLLWSAVAPNEKGLDAVVATLNAIAPLSQRMATESSPSKELENDGVEGPSPKPVTTPPTRVRVSSGVSTGLLIKKVTPVYPEGARMARIQGTVVLQGEISRTGDITHLELLDGPSELAGSAVAAVRQWKYRPYLLMGQPVAVETQIIVNYQLQ